MKITGIFLEHEFGGFERIFETSNRVLAEGIEKGREIVEAIIEEKEFQTRPIHEDFLCIDCDVACFKKCEKEFLSEECISCSECFRNCLLEHPTEFYRKRKKDAIISAVSYLYSRILVSNLDDWVRRRYAIKEAERYSKSFVLENPLILKLLASDLAVKSEFRPKFRSELRSESKSQIKVHVSSYLKVAVRLKSPNWRLLNRELKRGYISLNRTDFNRILEEHLRIKLSQKELAFVPEIAKKDIDVLKAKAARKRESLPKISFEKIEISKFPPCMRKILADLRAGVNLPHTARFALTSFLLNLGMDVDEIISLYKTAPDFDEDKTRYQVEHIAGAKGTEYETPSCETMKTYHNCFSDESCKGIYHPISYYKRELAERKIRAKKAPKVRK
ncbi:MAG: DNA primase large subunit PriL [Archaeoglobus sp.]|nr:DNA primase large subunit PriL [Archaeoglobus sp.]